MPPFHLYRTATFTAVLLIVLSALVHALTCTTVSAQKSKSRPEDAPKAATGPHTNGPITTGPITTGRNSPTAVHYGTDGLPRPVLEMREAILAAVRSGQIDELRVAIEMNEIKPNFGIGPALDPIDLLKQASADGQGREVLAALGNLLEGGYAILPVGRDIENNRIYVWPYFAETGVADLTPAQEVDLYRLVPAAAAMEMRTKGRYGYWRVGIGADGTWHMMMR